MAEMHVAVGPLLADRPTDGYWRRCMHRVMAEGQFVESRTAEPAALMSMLLVVRRDAFWSAGGFDEAYADPAGEDTALTMRMATYGTLGVDRSTSIYHDPHPDGCWPASRRLWRYGSAWAFLSCTHQSRTTQIQHLPRPLRYLCIAVVPLLAGIDALRHSSVTYWPGYTWLRICWYVGVLATPPLDRVTP
jgi:GT2 family glycosyltransferase